MILVTGGAGFIGSHVVDAAARRRARRPRRSTRCCPRRTARGRTTSTRRPSGSRATCATPRSPSASPTASTHVCAPGRDGRPRRRPRRPARLRVAQRPRRPPQLLRALAAARLRRAGSCSPRAWSSTARAATRAPSTASSAPAPRRPADLDAGRFEPACPRCGRPLAPRVGARGRAARPAQRLRGDEAGAGAPVRGVRQRDGRARDRAALPQRLRAADAARHAVRRGGQHLPLRLRRRPRPARVRGRRPAARLRPRPRRRARQRPRAHRAGARSRPVQRRQRDAADRARPRPRAASRLRRRARHRPAGHGEWRAGDVRHVVASPARAAERLGFAAGEDFDAGMEEFAAAPLRA